MKILPNESFGFMRITVERPLRLRWEITDETVAALGAPKGLAKLSDDARSALVKALAARLDLSGTDRGAAAKVVDPVLKAHGLTAPQSKAAWGCPRGA